MVKKTKRQGVKAASASLDDGLGSGVYGLAKEIEGVAEELHPLWRLEELADNVGHLALPLDQLAIATAMKVLAEYGTEEDRRAVIDYLRRQYLEEH